MSIPFTQYLLPTGQKRGELIDRPPDIEVMAHRFIASGGRYECEILRTGEVSLTAVAKVNGEEQDIAIVFCNNGPDVPSKVDELVRLSLNVQESAVTAHERDESSAPASAKET